MTLGAIHLSEGVQVSDVAENAEQATVLGT